LSNKNNYGYVGTYNYSNYPFIGDNGTGINGIDASCSEFNSGTAFWKNKVGFSTDDWNIQNGKLPTIKNVGETQAPNYVCRSFITPITPIIIKHKLTASKNIKVTKKKLKISKIKYDKRKLNNGKKIKLLFNDKTIGTYKLTKNGTLIIKSKKYKKFFKKLKTLVKKKYQKKWKKHYKKNKKLTIKLTYLNVSVNVKLKIK
jgi:hypothetical protein